MMVFYKYLEIKNSNTLVIVKNFIKSIVDTFHQAPNIERKSVSHYYKCRCLMRMYVFCSFAKQIRSNHKIPPTPRENHMRNKEAHL